MPQEPSFSAKPLNEPKQIKPKRTVRKKTARKKETAEEIAEDKKQNHISKQLTEIYRDEQGNLPDMKRIKIKKTRGGFKAFLTILLFAGLLAAVAWAGFFYMPGNKKFSEERVELKINGPSSTTIGATTTYKITYENKQPLALKKATLNIQYPDGFIFLSSDVEAKNSGHTEWQLGQIDPGKKKEISITGLTFGALNQKQSWRVFFKYQPENFGSELQKALTLDVTTDKSPFSLTLDGSNKTSAGNTADYTFTVKKESESTIKKLEVKPSWPKNFIIISSSPPINKDFKWIIEPSKGQAPNSSAPDKWTVKLTGRFTTSTESTNEIAGVLLTLANNKLFTIADTRIAPQVTKNELGLNLAINGSTNNSSIQPGGELNMTLSFKNTGNEDIDNAVLKLGLNGPAIKKQTLLNWSKIEDTYDGNIVGSQINDNLRRGEITWDKTKIPALATLKKGEEVVVDVRLPLRDATAINLPDLGKSSQITIRAEIIFKDSDKKDQKLSSNQIVVTVNSDLAFEARDSISGQKHQINWVLTNNFHPLKNLVVSADVLGDVAVELPATAPAGVAKFDPSTKKITWTIAEMPESVDVLALPIVITINKPDPTQDILVSKIHVQADDTVTGGKLDLMAEDIKLN